MVNLQYYISFKCTTQISNIFIDYTPLKLLKIMAIFPCAVQYIFVAYLFYT